MESPSLSLFSVAVMTTARGGGGSLLLFSVCVGAGLQVNSPVSLHDDVIVTVYCVVLFGA